jgi:adenylate kinase family enzyme
VHQRDFESKATVDKSKNAAPLEAEGGAQGMQPRRIVIVGCSGSGTSTLARKLGLRLALPVVHLDVLHYLPGWQRASLADFRERVTEAHRGEAWISEGNFASWTFDIRLPRAEALIVLERPRWLCLSRVFRRAAMERHNRPDLPFGCPEQIDRDLLEYIWNFEKVGGPQIEAARLNHGPMVPVLRLSRNSEVSAFLSSPQFAAPQPVVPNLGRAQV